MKTLFSFACATAIIVGSASAHAEKLYMPGAEGVLDNTNSICFDPFIPEGVMLHVGGADCTVAYQLNLPIGKVIDSVEIGYRSSIGLPSITAYLAQNRLKPDLGAIAIAGAHAQPPGGQSPELSLSIPALAIPISDGSIYWVQIFTTDIGKISYVEVSYH
jgi:hypothetical protein